MNYEHIREYAQRGFPGAMTYPTYRRLINELHQQNKVTGHEQTESLLEYSKLNEHRMNRWDRSFNVDPQITEMAKRSAATYTWLVITEGWCGDSAQVLPGIVKIAEALKNVNVLIALRDDNPDIMSDVIRGDKRAIPVVLCIDGNHEVIWKWGDRLKEAADLVAEHKSRADYSKEVMSKDLHLWYAKNAERALNQEFRQLIEAYMVTERVQ